MEILVEVVQVIIGIISGVFLTLGVIHLKGAYKKKPQQIGTIVVDHSDGAANIFLEIATDDIEKWEHNKEYSVKVEIRNYIPQK